MFRICCKNSCCTLRKNRNQKFEKTRPLEPDLCGFFALHVHARACIKPHRNSIYKAIATKFTAYDAKTVNAQGATNRTKKIMKAQFSGAAPHVRLKIHIKSIYKGIATQISG